MNDTFADRDQLRQNNFGASLILALFVLVSHSFAAYHGDASDQEILLRHAQATRPAARFAVNAFFAISGYLITLSWLAARAHEDLPDEALLHIYPGFIVASIFSLLIVAPLAGANGRWRSRRSRSCIRSSAHGAALGSKAPGSFAGALLDVLNMSLWTIRYEFICYLLVPLIVVLLTRTKQLRTGITILYLALLSWHASQGVYLAAPVRGISRSLVRWISGRSF